eukprot:14039986-Alexandrium_andersonii.AAC.1
MNGWKASPAPPDGRVLRQSASFRFQVGGRKRGPKASEGRKGTRSRTLIRKPPIGNPGDHW